MIGELRTLLSRTTGPGPVDNNEWPWVFLSATLDHYDEGIFNVMLKEGDPCIILYSRYDFFTY